MRTAAWWHCFAGIAGDMALASLVDAGADLDEIVAGLEKLPVTGWSLRADRVSRTGLNGTHLAVTLGAGDEPRRDWVAVRAILERAEGLPPRVVERSLKIFQALAEAEGRVHGISPEQVHFHEVGATDAILDIVGTCLGLELLAVDEVYASPVSVGLGLVGTAHGLLPNPAPAVVQLLTGAPVRGTRHPVELTTPTGAAILAALATSFGPVPPMRVQRSGFGAGTRELDAVPNMVQVVIGQLSPVRADDPGPAGPFGGAAARQEVALLEVNVDDITGEVAAHTVSALLAAGALDAWMVPVLGKKGRPALVLSALAPPAAVDGLAELVARETGALGARWRPVTRWALPRRTVEVDVDGRSVRVKVGPYRAKAEHDDCAAAAAVLGLPLADVARRAEQAATGVQTPIA